MPRLDIARGRAVFREAPGRRDPRRALRQVALDAATLLGGPDRDRLRICPGANCGGRFVDSSPAGRRRWCSMAVCGNRSKAAKHRDRSATTGLSAG